jgi:hypothetical protein
MLCRLALVGTDVSEEYIASIIIGTRISSVLRLLVTADAVPISPILVTLIMAAIRSSETSVLTSITRHNIPEDAFLLWHT